MATLRVEKRDSIGKYTAFNLRRDGFLPGIVYGKELQGNINIKIPFKEFEYLLKGHQRIIDLDIAGDTRKAIIQEVQHGTFSHEILHADFRTISETEEIVVTVSVEIKGEAAGVKEGGMVEQNQHEVEIECLPKDLPEKIEVDISHLTIGDVLYVADLPVLPGVKYLTTRTNTVASCHMPMGIEEAATAEAAPTVEGASTEPEVIGEKEREERRAAEGDKGDKQAGPKKRDA